MVNGARVTHPTGLGSGQVTRKAVPTTQTPAGRHLDSETRCTRIQTMKFDPIDSDTLVVRCDPEVCLDIANELRESAAASARTAPNLIFDLSDTQYLDSTGLGIFSQSFSRRFNSESEREYSPISGGCSGP